MRVLFQQVAIPILLLPAVLLAAEARQVNLPDKPDEYANIPLPEHFRRVAESFDNTPASNPVTNNGAVLGRVLFYDRTLSANGTTSCASCHQQRYAFTDDRSVSLGFDGQPVTRNSMSLVNVRYYRNGRMFWDERAATLEQQVLMPIENPVEMGHQLPALVEQLQADPLYPPLFFRAFGYRKVTKERMGRALAQFVRSIVSYQSRYDVGRAQVASVLEDFPNFTKSENYGKQQFFGRGKCASCHMEQSPHDAQPPLTQSALFYMFEPVVNGIDSDRPEADGGVAEYTGKKSDVGRFKVPSLRNIELTGPYMHDGRFRFIDQVIEHYNWSVKPHPNLDSRMMDFTEGLALPETEKTGLGDFLLTLTDRVLLTDRKFSDPFVPVKTAP